MRNNFTESTLNSNSQSLYLKEAISYFKNFAQTCINELKPNEGLALSYSGEDTFFTRLNQSLIRQSTHVQQFEITFKFQLENREQVFELQPSFEAHSDLTDFREFLSEARKQVKHLPEQPSFLAISSQGQSDTWGQTLSHPHEAILTDILNSCSDLDLCGLLTVGSQARGVINHLGLSHHFVTESYVFDYSCYTKNSLGQNKATKKLLSGSDWKTSTLVDSLNECRQELIALHKPSKRLERGKYKVFLGPQAVGEILGLMNWGSLSYRAFRQGFPFMNKLILDKQSLSPLFTMKDHIGLGLKPRFNDLGETMPESVPLIEKGQFRKLLTSSASAKEFSTSQERVETTYSARAEVPVSLEIEPGSLAMKDALGALGTGVYLNNLHYLNFSDPKAGRFTGMTRYACFWVEDGKLQEPIEDMRFDVSFHDVFGSGLEALTQECWILAETLTYGQREMGGCKVPGAIVNGFEFTF